MPVGTAVLVSGIPAGEENQGKIVRKKQEAGEPIMYVVQLGCGRTMGAYSGQLTVQVYTIKL